MAPEVNAVAPCALSRGISHTRSPWACRRAACKRAPASTRSARTDGGRSC